MLQLKQNCLAGLAWFHCALLSFNSCSDGDLCSQDDQLNSSHSFVEVDLGPFFYFGAVQVDMKDKMLSLIRILILCCQMCFKSFDRYVSLASMSDVLFSSGQTTCKRCQDAKENWFYIKLCNRKSPSTTVERLVCDQVPTRPRPFFKTSGN